MCVFDLFDGHTGFLAAQQSALKALVPNYTTQTLTEVPFCRITRIQEDTFGNLFRGGPGVTSGLVPNEKSSPLVFLENDF